MRNYEHPMYPALLAEVRKALSSGRFTQAQIGERLGINQSTVSLLLSGKTKMSIDQILNICDLVGVRLQNIARQAEIGLTQVVTMTPQIEEVLYKSDIHVICYVAATQEVSAADIKLKGVTQSRIQGCLDDLVKIGIVKKSGKGKYIQTAPNVTLAPTHRLRATEAHFGILSRTCQRHNDQFAKNRFSTPRFNWFELDRFTMSQVKEIESVFYQLFEKICAFQLQNQTMTYNSPEPMLLWNLHMMIFPATDEPHA